MKHLVVQSIGPVKNADIQLQQINVIIGPQSMGKSTILKLASFCTWVEKRIELTQSPEEFKENNRFRTELETFHKLQGYIHDDSRVEYESDYMKFAYEFKTDSFTFEWKEDRWKYHRPKISYIPAERNMVAAIPNWFEVTLERNNIRNFMAEWETARKASLKMLPVLNLHVGYTYEPEKREDRVQIQNGETMSLTNVSSGLQSLIPLFVHLNYIYSGIYDIEKGKTLAGDWADAALCETVYRELFVNKGRTKGVNSSFIDEETGKQKLRNSTIIHPYGGRLYMFSTSDDGAAFDSVMNQYLLTHHCEVFLEEPENNLFPTTQMSLARWLYEKTLGDRTNTLFIATHSPYVLAALLEKNAGIGFFYTLEKDGMATVRTATKDDCQAIYDYGVDAFFNIESLGE